MDKDDYMTRNDWLVQFLLTLMGVLVIGLALDMGAKILLYPSLDTGSQASLDSVRQIFPSPLSPLGLLLGFVYSLIVFFLMGVMKPKKRRPVRIS